ncbi:peptide ABC transporter substrate-binding protein [Kushneria phosphatilytica]|uniref:Peptide ABC transporter substrate-binding protein n=1 Tax=Kushneria phosphatilytica TaxID=657387 RepID=A0A1S1NVT5_9GAMM|nr:peptide ABC transporter substrate-binding protein [Kushneria phosphatilytica]OHV10892.1 peptide ABC transporter substrate-binding protein [Kushneria phosphatilytica]QEL12023.1 peptide ABC transporter substrate-binding protein [Kushneria phosphatilytica]
MVKYRLAAAAATGLWLSLASLTGQAATLNIGTQGEPASLDPARVNGTVFENTVLGDLYEGLITLGPGGEYLPGVAKQWDTSSDGRRWTFHLRDDARWSDGEPVTARDFVVAFRRVLDPATASVYASLLYPLHNASAISQGKASVESLGISAPDPHTLVLELDDNTPWLPSLLAHIVTSPVPAHLIERYGQQWSGIEHIATNGAFTPESWRSHDHIAAVRNRYFHDAEDVVLDGVNYYPAEDLQAGLSRFRAGELDIMRDFDPQRYQWLREHLGSAVHLHNQLATYYYALNSRQGHPTADPRVRQALNLALRRRVVTRQILKGAVEPTTSLVPAGISHYQPQPMPGLDQPMAQRQSEARTLLEEAGYGPDHPLTLRLRYNSRDDHRRIAVAVAAMWRPLGIRVDLINAEASVHYSSLAQGDFDVGRASWVADFDDASNFLGILQSGNPKNYGGYHSPAFDRLMAEAATETDPDQRQALLEQAERVAMSDYAMAPIYSDASRNLVNPKLAGWQDNAINRHPARWMHFDES